MNALAAVLAVAVLAAGCASSADIKPGVVSGIDKRGYVKTTEGFGHLVRGCPDSKVWTETLNSVKTIRPNDWRLGKALVLLDADEAAGRIRAEDPRTFVGTTSFIGVFIHRLSEDTRLIEVSAQWKTRMTVTENPWEGYLLQDIGSRLYGCLLPPEQAIMRLPR